MVEAIEGTICELWQGAQTARRVRNDRYFGTYLSIEDIYILTGVTQRFFVSSAYP